MTSGLPCIDHTLYYFLLDFYSRQPVSETRICNGVVIVLLSSNIIFALEAVGPAEHFYANPRCG